MIGQATQGKNDFDALEFELTDLDSARHALDSLPAGVEEVKRLRPGYWEERRRSPLPTDRAMAGAALEWLSRLPAEVRPRSLPEQYPRVVNRLADNWTSAQQCQATFDELMLDHRGGRRGFPHEIELELQRLRNYRAGLGRR
jgi:Asp-tRNA(Asn)/Glu-tRNA(Gln) amidotransferase A subunit family amidase